MPKGWRTEGWREESSFLPMGWKAGEGGRRRREWLQWWRTQLLESRRRERTSSCWQVEPCLTCLPPHQEQGRTKADKPSTAWGAPTPFSAGSC